MDSQKNKDTEQNIPVTDNTAPEPETPPEPSPDAPEETPSQEPQETPSEPAPEDQVPQDSESAPAQDSAPSSDPPEESSPSEPTISELSSETPKPKKSKLLPLLIILFVVLLLGAGALYYVLVMNPDFLKKPSQNNNQGTVEIAEETETESETAEEEAETTDDEVAIVDDSIKSALFNKLLQLHTPQTSKEHFKSNSYFTFSPTYNITDAYYDGTLTEADKLYVITYALLVQEQLKPLADLAIPENFFEEIGFINTLPAQVAESFDAKSAFKSTKGVEESVVENLYKNLFGTTPTHQTPQSRICGHLEYNEDYKIYYTSPVGGCGGLGYTQHLYVINYKQAGNEYYIDVAISEPYSADQAPTAAVINDSNYNDFYQYRFVFEKDNSGNYIYKTTEKL